MLVGWKYKSTRMSIQGSFSSSGTYNIISQRFLIGKNRWPIARILQSEIKYEGKFGVEDHNTGELVVFDGTTQKVDRQRQHLYSQDT